MKDTIAAFFLALIAVSGFTQNSVPAAKDKMTPEFLWKLGRVAGLGITKDGKSVVYTVATPNITQNKSDHETFVVSVNGGSSVQTLNKDSVFTNKNISPDGKHIIFNKEVKLLNMTGTDQYPELTKANASIYDNLNYRHWDTWEDGRYDHVFVADLVNGKPVNEKDIMPGEPFDCPQKPFGGDEDFMWSPDGKSVLYITKKKFGKEYATSTNTDLYEYDLSTGKTNNVTEGMMGYDVSAAYNKKGILAWLSMNRDGFEADKQDLIIMSGNNKINITKGRDDLHVEGFKWSNDGNHIYFWAAVRATEQIFDADISAGIPNTVIRQVTNGEFQVSDIIGDAGNAIIASKTDMNHAPEMFAIDKTTGSMLQLSHVNDNLYNSIDTSKAQRRFVKTTDGKQMPVWVVYPPNFDPAKKYPTLLFCLGGPQGLTPFYSFRWNFQLMAAQGYIVVAPDRRGVFGNGTKWAADISKDWGGQALDDYLSAIDDISKEKFVDKDRRGCVGASYGGYSVYMLESLHNGRFKSFIAHDGLFDLKSWSGTTEELWFNNWDIGGPYWDTKNKAAQKSYSKFSPSNFVNKWSTPILIVQGGKDFRVPVEQGLQAFQAAQLKGIKSRLLYLPDENHWVLGAQNALVWQHEFFRWLDETLK